MQFNFTPVIDNLPYILGGLQMTATLSICVIIGSGLLGLLVGLSRTYGPAWLRIALGFYVDTMRAIPELVVLIWIFFALPLLTGVTLPSFWAALVALTIQVAAYVSEIVRAGLGSIRQGQTNAGRALGMSMPQILLRILLPQVLVRMIPAYNTIVSMTIKDTAIASMIAVPELMRRSETLASQSYRPVEVFTTALILYFLILFPVTRLIELLYRRVAHLGRS